MTKQQRVFINIVSEFASLSHCVSYKVAAIAVLDGRIICTGINGTPPGVINCDDVFDTLSYNREEHKIWSDKYEIHAEQNLILRAARDGISLNKSDIYCTLLPCLQCIKMLSVLGIKNIFYRDHYDRISEEELSSIYDRLRSIGINIEKLD